MCSELHPGFVLLSSYDYRYVEVAFGADGYSDFKEDVIRDYYRVECLPLPRPKCNFDGYGNSFGFYIPIQLKKCKTLEVLKLGHYGSLLSTKGLPLKVFDKFKIKGQMFLDLNELDYSGLERLEIDNCKFKNLDFIKAWNVPWLIFNDLNISSIEQLNDGLENLTITSINGPLDFANISNLRKLKGLNFSSFSSQLITLHPEWFVNVIEILNITNDISFVASINNVSPFYANEHRSLMSYMLFPVKQRKEYIMDCLINLLDAGFINAGG